MILYTVQTLAGRIVTEGEIGKSDSREEGGRRQLDGSRRVVLAELRRRGQISDARDVIDCTCNQCELSGHHICILTVRDRGKAKRKQ